MSVCEVKRKKVIEKEEKRMRMEGRTDEGGVNKARKRRIKEIKGRATGGLIRFVL